MRMARSTSPRRRKRLPSANCSSTVCGFSLATCRNDSIALSGCSFSRKFRPRKYDEGSARDSESSDFRSTRAATQPMPKNTGRASSHQNSKSMGLAPALRSGRPRRAAPSRAPRVVRGARRAARRTCAAARSRAGWRITVGTHASSPIKSPATNATSSTNTSGASQTWSSTPWILTSSAFLLANHTSRRTMRRRMIQTSACMG